MSRNERRGANEIARTKILMAAAELMAERAAGRSVSLADVIERSGISSAAFHVQFDDLEACLLAAFELGLERARRRVFPSYDAERRWLDSIKRSLVALLEFLEEEPALGALLAVHSLSGGRRLLRRRAAVLAQLADVVDRGRFEMSPGRRQPPPVIAEGAVGAVLAVVQNRLLVSGSAGVIELYGSLVSIVALPYLGAGVAQRELARPAPRPRARPQDADDAPSSRARDVGVRLTYRTMRVLGAIAEYPGASNREVADRSGIVDQGQVSKLLARLHARGLIAKAGDGRARGAPNSWHLTGQGEAALGTRFDG